MGPRLRTRFYSQRFQKDDFGDAAPFDPKVLPNEYLTAPKAAPTFVYVSTIQRMARNLFGAEGGFPQSDGDPDIEDDAHSLRKPVKDVTCDVLCCRWIKVRKDDDGVAAVPDDA